MKVETIGDDVVVTLTPRETRKFARAPGARWPCSVTAGREVFARFSGGDLVDLEVDGDRVDVPADEFNALVEHYVGTAHPTPDDVE